MGEPWWARAGCRGRDPAWWDLDSAPELNDWAMRICRSCPVRFECTDEAVEKFDTGVIRGGLVFKTRAAWVRCTVCRSPFVSFHGSARRCPSCVSRGVYGRREMSGASR